MCTVSRGAEALQRPLSANDALSHALPPGGILLNCLHRLKRHLNLKTSSLPALSMVGKGRTSTASPKWISRQTFIVSLSSMVDSSYP